MRTKVVYHNFHHELMQTLHKNEAMHYSVGQEVYGGHVIDSILEEDEKYRIYITKNNEVLPWKDFNKNMAIAVEYNLEY